MTADGFVGGTSADIWALWTTADGLHKWLTPHADIDLRVGGLLRTNYRENEVLGDPGTIIYTIKDFEPRRMLLLQITTPPRNWQFPNAVKTMQFAVFLDTFDERSTRVRIVAAGFAQDDESQRMRTFFQEGNAILLEQLQNYFVALRQGH